MHGGAPKPDQLAQEVLKILDKLADSRNEERGSVVDARRFEKDQLATELDFRTLLAGLGRDHGKHSSLMVNPVLSDGHLTLDEPLHPDAVTVVADAGGGDELWRFSVADAAATKKGLDLQHIAITIVPPAKRLTALDARHLAIQLGYPMIRNFRGLARPL